MAAVLVANPHSIHMPSPTVGGLEAKKRTKSAPSKATAVTRGRRERPCDACRKRKSKCVINEEQKTCAACGVHGQECTFVEDPQPRKRRIEGEAKDAEALKRRSVASPAVSVPEVPVHEPEFDRPQLSLKVETEISTNVLRESSNRQFRHYGTHIGPTSEVEPILMDLAATTGTIPQNGTYRRADGRTSFLANPIATESVPVQQSVLPRTLDRLIGTHGMPLIRLYLNNIHPNFPIIQSEFFSDHKTGRRTNLDPALLAAVYSVTIPWLLHENSGAASQLPDSSQVDDIALRLFGDSLCRPTLSTVQAGLLLMQRPNFDSKTLNTQLVGITHELGLHLDCSSWMSSVAEKGLRKRLAWALYMQDKWCSLIHGRPSIIFQNNWAVRDLVDEDFDMSCGMTESSISVLELERGRALIQQMVKLTEILSTVLDTFFTLQAMQEIDDAGQGGTRLILERAKPVQICLKDWFAKLPPNLKIDTAVNGRPSSIGYLHLAYFATEITLHRCIIRSLEASNGDPYLAHICRSAAKTRLISAMDFVNRLRPEHLNSFWYFPSKVDFALIGTFGILLLATAPCQEEADFYQTRLSEYRWTLGVSSKTIGFLSFAIDSLDSSLSLLANIPRKPSISEIVTRIDSLSNSQSASSPKDEQMIDAPPMHLGHLPRTETGGLLSNVSGLASPSTSTSSGSTTYEAYVEAFPNQSIRSLSKQS